MPRVTRKSSEGRHQCGTCGYLTDRKSSMEAHNNRKKPCTPQPFVRMVTAPDGSKVRSHGEDQCKHCNKTLSCKKSLKRHMETCKSRKHDEWALQNQKDEVWRNLDTKKPLVEGKFRCIRCHRDFASRQALHMHTKRVCPSVKNLVRVIDRRIEEQSGGEGSPTPFRKFGFETVQHITDNMWMRWCRRFMLSTRAGGALNLMDMIWFNPTQPQNHNVRYTNKKLRYAEIWTGERWSLEDKNWVADQILDRIANDFDCYLHNNKVRLQSMTGNLAFHRNIVKGVKELVDIVLLNKNPREKRRMRTRMISKMHDFSKKVSLWASKTPFDKETMMKHQAALECARKADSEDTCYSMNREMERIKSETKKEIEQEVRKRVEDALLQMGLTEEQIEAARKRARASDPETRADPPGAGPSATPAPSAPSVQVA
jgi:hypothetical protein